MILDRIFGLGLKVETRSRTVLGYHPTSPLFGGLWGGGDQTEAGIDVTPETPMTVSAWYAAVRLIGWTTAYLPLKVFERQPNGDRQPQPSHPLYNLLHNRPNGDMNAMVYRELGIINILLWGNAYSYIDRDRHGVPASLWPLEAKGVRVSRFGDRSLAYDIQQLKDPPTDKPVLMSHEVLHVPGLGFDGIKGRSVVSFAREQVGEAVAAQKFAGGFYSSGAQQNIALKYTGSLKKNPELANRLRRQWVEKHRDPKAGPAVLESGMDVVDIGMPLKDAEYIASRQFSVTEAARWTGLPPHKLADLTRSSFNNIAEQNIEFVQALLPWMVRFEQEYDYKLFTAAERGRLFAEHVTDALLQADPEKQNKALALLADRGIINRNEVRKLKGMNSMGPAGDIHSVQVNMCNLDTLLPGEKGKGEKEEEEKGEAEERSAVINRVQGAFRDAIERMIHKEALEARRAAENPAKFLTWLDHFYQRTWPQKLAAGVRPAAEVCRAVGPIEFDAAAWAMEHCRQSKAALLEISGVAKADELAARVDQCVVEWERSLPAAITGSLFSDEEYDDMNRHDEERRCFRPGEELRILATEGQPTKIEGLAVPYNELSEDLGEFREMVKRGAFSESLRSKADMRADVEHDHRIKLGRRSKGTLEFRDDERGLWATITIPETTIGRDTLEEVRNGLLDAMSVSWKWEPIEAAFVERGGEMVREVRKAVLTGVTLTAYPAYPQTAGELALRSLEAWKAEQGSGDGEEEYLPDIDTLRRRLELAEAEV